MSWHADSCLEHYSTIAVYHVTDPDTGGFKDVDRNGDGRDSNGGGGGRSGSGGSRGDGGAVADWRIALRVEPDAEGPSAGKLKLAAAAASEQVGPALDASLRVSAGVS